MGRSVRFSVAVIVGGIALAIALLAGGMYLFMQPVADRIGTCMREQEAKGVEHDERFAMCHAAEAARLAQ